MTEFCFLYTVHWHLAISLYSRDSPTRILDLQLVPFFQPTWATDQRDEIFLILVTISKIYLKELQYIKITEIKSLDEISTSEWNSEQNVMVFQGRLHQIFLPYYTICWTVEPSWAMCTWGTITFPRGVLNSEETSLCYWSQKSLGLLSEMNFISTNSTIHISTLRRIRAF